MTGPARYNAADIAQAAGLAHRPTAEQARIIEAEPGPLLVVAGAGSGKTETMAARVVWLVVNGFVEPDQVLGLTFTRKAAAELGERITLRLRRVQTAGLWSPRVDEAGAEVLGGTPTIGTYHSYAGRLVREHALRLGIEPESRLLTEAAAWQYAAEAVAHYDGDLSELTRAESTVITAVLDLSGELAEHLCDTAQLRDELDRMIAALDATPLGRRKREPALRDVRAALAERRSILPIVDRFQALKRSRDAMDFADQVALAARLASRFPDIAAAERSRFATVLLDEFQDTSEAQLALLRDLFGAGEEPIPVIAVGDPHQSIYGWRGASSSTLARFPHEFPARAAGTHGPARPAPVADLATTWRNDEAILRCANRLAQPLGAGARVPVAALGPRPGAGPGDVEVARLGTHVQEAAYLAQWLRGARSRAGTSAAVLCRKRSQFAVVITALEDAGLPYEVLGLGGLLLTPEIVDLVALLRVVSDPLRGDALMRLITGAICRLGTADLDALHEWARFRQRVIRRLDLGELPLDLDPARRDEDEGTDAARQHRLADLAADAVDEPSLVEAVEELPPTGWTGPAGQRLDPQARARLEGLAGAIRRVRALGAIPLPDLVGEAERALGLDIEVQSRPEYAPEAARAHLDAFADVAADFAGSADRPTLSGFLAWLDAAQAHERGLELGAREPSPDAVQVLTVHAAKGLEWDVVAVPGLVEGTFPTWKVPPTVRAGADGWTVEEPMLAGWTGGLSGLPYSLRGDRASLPGLELAGARDGDELTSRRDEFKAAEGQRAVLEERRLAYVALTRARRRLLLSAPVWMTGAKPRVTSRFLEELLADREALGLRIAVWEPMPDSGDIPDNPVTAALTSVLWPADPLAARRADLLRAQAQFRTAQAEASARPTLPFLIAAQGYAADVAALLAERQAHRERVGATVAMPRHLSASDVVRLARDPEAFAASIRRPMPSEPALAARRGTLFHAWVEQHYARAALVDLAELPGAADDTAQDGADHDLPVMQANFLASEWADATPIAVEVAIETVLDGIAVRGRIDAVFARPGGGVSIVDWKTGDPPRDERDARTRAIQLGTYALAYARLAGLGPTDVDAAFFYARTGVTVRPQLPDEAELVAVLRAVPD